MVAGSNGFTFFSGSQNKGRSFKYIPTLRNFIMLYKTNDELNQVKFVGQLKKKTYTTAVVTGIESTRATAAIMSVWIWVVNTFAAKFIRLVVHLPDVVATEAGRAAKINNKK